MKCKRHLKWWHIVVVLILVILMGTYGAYLYIPTYIENSLLPKISKELDTNIEASVRRFDSSGADLENVVLTNDDGKLHVDSIRLDYSLKDLLDGHIAGLTISGADLSVSVKANRKFVISGIDIEALQNRKPTEKEPTPWAIDVLALKNCNLNLSYHENLLRVPFQVEAKSLSNKLDKCTVVGQIYPFGQKLAFSTSLDSANNKLKTQVQMSNFNTAFLDGIIAPQNSPELDAAIALDANFNFNLNPFSFKKGNLEIKSEDLKYHNSNIGVSLTSQKGQASSIKITGQDSSFHIDLQGLYISDPIEAVVTATPSLTIEGDNLKLVGNLCVRLPQQLHTPQAETTSPTPLTLHCHATINKKTNNWQVKVNSKPESHISQVIRIDNQQLSLPNLALLIEAKGNFNSAQINYNLNSKEFSYQTKTLSAAGDTLTLSGNVNYEKGAVSGQYDVSCEAFKGTQKKQTGTLSMDGDTIKIAGNVNYKKGTASGRYDVSCDAFKGTQNSQTGTLSMVGDTIKIAGNVNYEKGTASGRYDVSCDAFKGTQDSQSGTFSMDGDTIKIAGNVNYEKGAVSGQCTVSCETLQGNAPDGKLKLNKCKVNDTFKLKAGNALATGTHKIELNASHATVSYSNVESELSNLKCELGIDQLKKITGVINVGQFHSSYPALKISTAGHLQVPFSWPFAPSNQEGFIKLNEITYNGKDLGILSLKTTQKNNHYNLSGELQPSIPAGAMVHLSAQIDKTLSKATLDYKLHKIKLTSLGELEELIDTSSDIDLNGWIACHGQIFYQNGVIDASTDLAINDANVILSEEGDKLQGVNLWLAFPSLRKMKSKPKQYFSFDKAQVGKVKLGKSLVEFQLEAKDQFFLEKCDFSWCGGKLFSHALRFNPLDATMKMVLFCKDIQLNALAEDFYDMNLETDAMLSGSIPLWIKDDRLYFQKGLLYTVPGKLGKIKVKNDNILTKSLSKTMPQYGKLSFVENAMKDFNYDWVKFVVKTNDADERTLQASLSFFGKPSDKLEFTDKGTTKLYDPLKSPPLVPKINVNIDYKLFDIYNRYKKVISLFN